MPLLPRKLKHHTRTKKHKSKQNNASDTTTITIDPATQLTELHPLIEVKT